MKNPAIDYVETTTPITWVGVLATNATPDEERAQDEAMAHLGTDTTPAWCDEYAGGWAFAFENGYLA